MVIHIKIAACIHVDPVEWNSELPEHCQPYRQERCQTIRCLFHCYVVREKHLTCAGLIRVFSLGFLNCEIEGKNLVSCYVTRPRPHKFWDFHKTCFLSYRTRKTVEACLQTGERLLQENSKEKQEMERKSWWFFSPWPGTFIVPAAFLAVTEAHHSPQFHKIDIFPRSAQDVSYYLQLKESQQYSIVWW